MITSDQGRKFIQSYEKLRLEAYKDAVGVWTIGYGHTNSVCAGDTCTEEEADKWFDDELHQFENTVNNCVKVPLKQNQFDALVSFTYNLGSGALRSSTLLKLLNLGNYLGAANRFENWNRGMVDGKLVELPGLTKRREAERQIFQQNIYEMHD